MTDRNHPVEKTIEDPTPVNDHPASYASPLASVHIAPEVLLTITRLTATQVPGVSRLCSVPGGVNRLFKKNIQQADGLVIEFTEDAVYIDIYVALKSEVIVRDVCRDIQSEVQRAITEMVGMHVGRVNIHVEDIDYPEEDPS
jgi:uncharacterized alkaline shock family protein YloU